MQPKGLLTEDGQHATLTFRRVYRHSVQRVWDAIATEEGLRGWLLCSHAQIQGQVGGRIEMVSGPSSYHSTGQILAWAPPYLLEYEWNVAPVPEMPRGERAIFRFELTSSTDSSSVDSTVLLVTYRRITRQTAPGFLPGLHVFLDRLEAQLDAQPLPDWLARFAELRTTYSEWSAHASVPGK